MYSQLERATTSLLGNRKCKLNRRRLEGEPVCLNVEDRAQQGWYTRSRGAPATHLIDKGASKVPNVGRHEAGLGQEHVGKVVDLPNTVNQSSPMSRHINELEGRSASANKDG